MSAHWDKARTPGLVAGFRLATKAADTDQDLRQWPLTRRWWRWITGVTR